MLSLVLKSSRLILIASCALQLSVYGRVWTSVDGKEVEGEYISSTKISVKIKRTQDGSTFSLPISKLSEADRNWLESLRSGEGEELNIPPELETLIHQRGNLIFADSFNRDDSDEVDDLGTDWNTNSESRAGGDKQNDLVDGTLVMTISPNADHGISTRYTSPTPYKNLILHVRMKIPENGSLKLAYNDRKDKTVHAGHINGITIKPTSIKLDDERTGRFNLKYREDKNSPEAKDAFARSAKTFKVNIKPDAWHDVVTFHNDETVTVFIDGKEVATFKSPGFGHETKRDLAFAVPKKATVDDLRIWEIR